MTDGHIHLDIRDHISTVTIDRPGKRNALSTEMRVDLLKMLREADCSDRVRVIIVTGAGGDFCAGGDIHVLRELKNADDEAGFARLLDDGKEIVALLRESTKPTIAMVDGVAAGAGFLIAMACDLRMAGEHAKFGLPFVRLGLGPDWGGTYLLPRLLGTAKALELLYTGEPIDANEAQRIGLVNRIWPAAELTEQTRRLAARLASGPTAVMARYKRAIHATWDASFETTAGIERQLQLENFRGPDCAEGIAAFLEKRAPRFGPLPHRP
ncbi:MAG: enoyl-CoA hydratase [Candidatus Zixiibacteriota bacterium]